MTPLDLLLWRTTRKISKTDLACRLGVNPRTVWTWETGAYAIPATLAARLTALPPPAPGASSTLPICYRTHPQFYSKIKAGRRRYLQPLASHPHQAWALDVTRDAEGNVEAYNTRFAINGAMVDVREVAHMPAGTVLLRSDDGQTFYQWVVPQPIDK